MKPFPQLNTERLTLRQLQQSDLAELVRQVNQPEIFANILNFPNPYTEQDAADRMDFVTKGYEEGARVVFAIAMQESDAFMGEVGLHFDRDHNRAEMGCWIGEAFRNKGYMTEAVRAVLRFGFEELGLHKIMATHFLENGASGKVLVKSGMILEGELKDHYLHAGAYRSFRQYRLTRDEFDAQA